MHDVSLIYNGGSPTANRIDAGSTHVFHVSPKGETDLEIAFTNHRGEKRHEKIDVYLGSGYTGHIDVEANGSGKVTWTNKTTVR